MNESESEIEVARLGGSSALPFWKRAYSLRGAAPWGGASVVIRQHFCDWNHHGGETPRIFVGRGDFHWATD